MSRPVLVREGHRDYAWPSGNPAIEHHVTGKWFAFEDRHIVVGTEFPSAETATDALGAELPAPVSKPLPTLSHRPCAACGATSHTYACLECGQWACDAPSPCGMAHLHRCFPSLALSTPPPGVSMRALPNNAPTNVAVLDARDPNAGHASHLYGVQFGGPRDVVKIPFQHGARGVEGSTPGLFDDDLLAIVQDRLEGFQSGPFACPENAEALTHIQGARVALGQRVARRIAQGVLGDNRTHQS